MNIICEGLMLGNSGFAEAMRNIALSLDKMGCNVKTVIHDACNIGESRENTRLLKLKETKLPYGKIPWITMTYPLGVQNNPDYYSIAYVMFETEKFPKDFAEHLKNHREIWTPTEWGRQTMIDAGLKNIHVMPLGVDMNRFNPDVTPLDCPQEMNGKFKFLSIFGWSARKGVDVLVKAYTEEFLGCDDVALYLKGGWYNERKANREIYQIRKLISGKFPYIKTDFKLYSLEDLPKLYKMCDCFVMPTRGEGWGLEFSESMAMGMPTIATNWSGQTEFMNNNNSYLIDVESIQPCPACDWITPYYKGAGFAEPSVSHLRKLMRDVYENRDKAKLVGERGRKDISNYTWEKSMTKVYNRLKEIYDK